MGPVNEKTNIKPNNQNQGFEGEEINSISPIDDLPEELFTEILSNLNFTELLGTISLVSKKWYRLANDDIVLKKSIYMNIACGNDKWAKHFGSDKLTNEDRREEFSSFPFKEFIEDSRKFKNIYPKINAKDILMPLRLPKTFTGGINITNVSKISRLTIVPYLYDPSLVDKALLNKSIEKSCWVFVPKNPLPQSTDKSSQAQQDIIANLAQEKLIGYRLPETLEAVAFTLIKYIDHSVAAREEFQHLFVPCQEKIANGQQLIVTNYNFNDQEVHSWDELPHSRVGVTPLRSF